MAETTAPVEAELTTAPSTIPANPVEALASVEQPVLTSAEQRARDEKGRFAAQAKKEKEVEAQLATEFPDLFKKQEHEQPEVGAEVPAKGSKKAETEPASEAAKPTARQVGRAIEVLKRMQYPQARIDALSDLDKVELGRLLKPVVVERQQAAQKANGSQSSQAIQGAQSADRRLESPPTPALDHLKEAVKDIEKEHGPEFAATLEKALRAAVAPFQQELAQARAQANQAGEARLQTLVNDAREALADRFPELEDQETFDEDVLPFMVGLHQTGRYDMTDSKQVAKLLTQAARAAELEEVQPQAKAEEKEQLARLTRNGTSTSRTKPIPNAPKSQDDRMRLATKLALDPTIPVEEARRLLAGS